MMATCGIWKISSNLGKVIEYTTNEEKTERDNELINELHKTINYINDDGKTEIGYYVTGINCSVKHATEEMQLVKETFEKKNGIQGYHAFQSFKEGEVTPEQAHRIGIQLAEEMWGDRYQVIVATHLNTENYHNHFVINSVSFVDGKKCEYSRTSYAELRKLNDTICEEHGLSVLEEKPTRKHINYANYTLNEGERINYYSITKKDIDYAIAEAINYNDFLDLMKQMDYTVVERYGRLSVKRNDYNRNIRIERAFDKSYTIENIKKRIQTTVNLDSSLLETKYMKKYHIEPRTKKKYHGLLGLYRYYCYLLKVYPSNIRKYKLPPSMKLDVLEMERISQETILLAREKIENNTDFDLYKNILISNIRKLQDEKNKLWYQYKNNPKINKQDVITKIDKVNEKLKDYKKDYKLCNSIEIRKEKLENNLKDFQEREEVYRNESIR